LDKVLTKTIWVIFWPTLYIAARLTPDVQIRRVNHR